MERLTKSDIVSIVGNYGFTEIKQDCRFFNSCLLLSFEKANSNFLLDCILENGIVYISSTRQKGDSIPKLSILKNGRCSNQVIDLNRIMPTINEVFNHQIKETERKTEDLKRIGQDTYRKEMMQIWDGACALTGINIPDLLIASHAIPWKDSDYKEKLDPYNGFLFEARIDKLFDQHLISFQDDGEILINSKISKENRELLHLKEGMKLRKIFPQNIPYLRLHRQKFMST